MARRNRDDRAPTPGLPPGRSADPQPEPTLAGSRRGSNTRARAAAGGAAFALLLALVGGVAYVNRSDDDVTTAVPTTVDPIATLVIETTAVPVTEATTTAVPTTTLFPPGCPAPDGSSARQVSFASPPPSICIDPTASYTAVVTTSKGTMEFALDVANAPATVNNFVSLARFHFYDGLPFHRVVPGFVLQTGDPDGSGGGGPGYTIPDEFPVGRGYKVGALAMANAGPGTAGSQFFIVSGPDGVALDPEYAMFGQLISGLDVIRAIDAIGAPDPDPPTEQVIVNTVTITQTPAAGPGITTTTLALDATAGSTLLAGDSSSTTAILDPPTPAPADFTDPSTTTVFETTTIAADTLATVSSASTTTVPPVTNTP